MIDAAEAPGYLANAPRATDGTFIYPGDRVSMPWDGSIIKVREITFGHAPNCAYVNGFCVLRNERMQRIDENGKPIKAVSE